MIFDTLSNLQKYRNLPGMEEVMGFVQNRSLNEMKIGRYELPNGIWCTVSDSKTKRDGSYEVHRRYADVQIVLTGSERIDWLPLEDCCTNFLFSVKDDVGFFDADSDRALSLSMLPGTFAVFYPEDAYKPLLRFKHEQVKKAVFKLPIMEEEL